MRGIRLTLPVRFFSLPGLCQTLSYKQWTFRNGEPGHNLFAWQVPLCIAHNVALDDNWHRAAGDVQSGGRPHLQQERAVLH